MRRLIKKIHMYAGLLTFTAFTVYGIAGLHATFASDTPPRTVDAQYVDFAVPGNVTDKELADNVYRALDLPLTGPIPAYAVRRDGTQHLVLNFYTVNGVRRVTVLEEEHRLRIERERSAFVPFLGALHASVLAYAAPRFLTLAWAWYNELATWSLLLMSVTSVYLWLASRPRHRLAQVAVLAGSGSFLALYWMTR